MYAYTQVEGLKTTLVIFDVCRQPCADLVSGLLVITDAGTDYEIFNLL